MKFHEIIKSLRLKKKYTQRKAAELLNISHADLCNIENNKKNRVPTLELIEKMEHLYGINPYILYKLQGKADVDYIVTDLKRIIGVHNNKKT